MSFWLSRWLGICLDGMVGAEQVGVAGEGVVQVDIGTEANMVHLGGEAVLGWWCHMAMST